MSLARAHRERMNALLLAGTVPAGSPAPAIDPNAPETSEYQQLLASLHNDLRTLHEIQSVQGKIDRKRGMIGAYLPWVEGALAAGADNRAVQDEIVVTMMVWALDIDDWELGLTIAAHVLDHGLALPDRYNRTPACLVVDMIADRAKAEPAAVPLEVLTRAAAMTCGHDMPDQANAKLQRAIGLAWAARAEAFDPTAETAVAGGKAMMVDAALTALREAVRLNAQVGVKKQLEQLEREAKKLAEAAATQEEGQ